ncbi:type II toxin-antitoxin system HicB family antitoxin [uncultured Sphaerochaeta sp.]|uniref:type II toxin-antitoxin system HicB family antitoxin n=1 Tax=uncultured Sphaerochaeta sp. TaxID=886478 RepID=UPI002626F123|nr:type II toxin-antitoxin system HicB family antitoxin [uncultured Sphaerochaeta sp.]
MRRKRTVKDFLKLPYTKELVENEDRTFFIKVKELPGCMSEGDTLEEAFLMIRDAMEVWLQAAIEDGIDIPLPESMEKEYSGKVPLRLPKSLHKKVAENARRDGVSLNTYLICLISAKDSHHSIVEEVKSVLSQNTPDWRFMMGSGSLSWEESKATIKGLPKPVQLGSVFVSCEALPGSRKVLGLIPRSSILGGGK